MRRVLIVCGVDWFACEKLSGAAGETRNSCGLVWNFGL